LEDGAELYGVSNCTLKQDILHSFTWVFAEGAFWCKLGLNSI
jgi:hypothetical protein